MTLQAKQNVLLLKKLAVSDKIYQKNYDAEITKNITAVTERIKGTLKAI